jgi:hypothetical protein
MASRRLASVVDEPRKLLDGHVVGRDRPVGNRIGRGFGLGDLRFEMPSGRSPRTWSTAFFTSATAPLMSVPILNWTIVWLEPSDAVEVIVSTPAIVRTALSMRWVIWVSISVGRRRAG